MCSKYLDIIACSKYLDTIACSKYLDTVACSKYLNTVACSKYLNSVARSIWILSPVLPDFMSLLVFSVTRSTLNVTMELCFSWKERWCVTSQQFMCESAERWDERTDGRPIIKSFQLVPLVLITRYRSMGVCILVHIRHNILFLFAAGVSNCLTLWT